MATIVPAPTLVPGAGDCVRTVCGTGVAAEAKAWARTKAAVGGLTADVVDVVVEVLVGGGAGRVVVVAAPVE